MRIASFLIGILLGYPCLTWAQTRFKAEGFGTLGTAWHEVSGAAGLNVGAGFGWRPFAGHNSALRGLGVGGELNYSPNITDSPDGVSSRTTATGDVRYHFTLGRVEPFVGIGLGFSDFTRNPGRSAPGNPRAIYVGAAFAGMNFVIRDHWFLRPEFRAFNGIFSGSISGPGGNERHLYRTSVGIGYRW